MPRRTNTRGAQGGGSIRQRPDGRWEARYTVGRDPGTGRQVQRSIYGATQAEVRKALQKATTAIDEGIYVEPSKLTLAKWLDIWLDEYTADLKPLTVISYRRQVENHIKPALGARKLSAISAHEIQILYNDLHRGDKSLSPKTIKNVHGVLHKALAQAVELGYIRFNASDACKLPRIEKTEIQPLNEAEISAFLAAIKGHMYEYVYTVDLFTGMRQGEILGLTWDCVDFKNGTIHVYRQLQKISGVYQFNSLKNGKTRLLRPASFVMNVLQEQRREQARAKLKAGSMWDNSKDFVFTNEIGGHLTHFNVYKHFKRIVEGMGIPSARFHDLRHSFAVVSLQSGDSVKVVQENLGHHTASFTLDTYGHVTERMKQESANRMDSFISGLKNL